MSSDTVYLILAIQTYAQLVSRIPIYDLWFTRIRRILRECCNRCEVAFYDVLRSEKDALLLHSSEPRGNSLETSKLTQYPQLSDWSGNILKLAFPSSAASGVWWVVDSVLLAKNQRTVTLDFKMLMQRTMKTQMFGSFECLWWLCSYWYKRTQDRRRVFGVVHTGGSDILILNPWEVTVYT